MLFDVAQTILSCRSRHGILGICLAVFLVAGSGTLVAADIQLARFNIDKRVLSDRTRVHPVNLLDGPELELVLVSPAGQAIIMGQTATGFTPLQTIPLPLPPSENQHIYYGFARLEAASHHSLVLLSPGSVNYYPVVEGRLAPQPQRLFESELIGQSSPGPVQRPFDMALDLNGDGVDELLLPGDNGFSISRQTEEGRYTKINLPRNAFSVKNSFTFSRDIPEDSVRPPFFMTALEKRRGASDLLFFDANGDDKLDLIYSSTALGPSALQVERYDVFQQKDNLTFESEPSQSFAVPYDSQADVTFRDINQDGRLDAVLVRSNLDVVNPRTVIKFFIGKGDGYQVFTKETDRFVTKDPVGLVQLNDFNNDGVTDFAMTFFSYQFGSMEDIVDLAFANKLQFRLQFFLGRDKQGFPRRADSEQLVTLNTKLEDFRGNPPVMMVDDMNGDGMMDLLVRSSATVAEIYFSRGNYMLSPEAAGRFDVPEQATLSFTDVNADNLTDIIVSDPSTDHLSIIVPLKR